MPLYQLIRLNNNQAYGIWRIEELEGALVQRLQPKPADIALYRTFRNPTKRMEWLASRLVYQLVCEAMAFPCLPLMKNAQGRPSYPQDRLYVSISHCFPFAAVMLSQHTPIGIDIQIPHAKLYTVQKKYLQPAEIADSNQALDKLCIYWCAKEAIYKAHFSPRIALSSIRIRPFVQAAQGTLAGQVLASHCYVVHYQVSPAYVIAWSQASGEE